MRKIILGSFIIIFLHGLINIYGQQALSRDTYSITGTIQYTWSQSENYLIMTPQFAYFPVSHFSLGGFFQINNYDHEIDAKYILSIRGLSLGASARYYFQIEKATPFLELSGIINSSQYGIGYKVGIDYFLSNNVSFEPSIAFINMQAAEMYENREKINTKVLIIGIGVNCFIF